MIEVVIKLWNTEKMYRVLCGNGEPKILNAICSWLMYGSIDLSKESFIVENLYINDTNFNHIHN